MTKCDRERHVGLSASTCLSTPPRPMNDGIYMSTNSVNGSGVRLAKHRPRKPIIVVKTVTMRPLVRVEEELLHIHSIK